LEIEEILQTTIKITYEIVESNSTTNTSIGR
jgi:hypothetical protein